jgi:hypothetical protein
MAQFSRSLFMLLLTLSLGQYSKSAMATPEVSGFINAVGGYAMERPTQGYEADNLTFERDSLLGLQVSGRLNDKMSATGQLLAQGQDDFTTEASWAYLTYEFSQATQFRMGRFRTPLFLYSDFLHVGYAQHWMSPPEEVYGLPFDSVNGVDLNYGFSLGRTDAKLQMYFGSSQGDFTPDNADTPLHIRLREQMGVVGSLNRGWFTARASFHQVTRLSIDNFGEQSLPDPFGNVEGLSAAITNLGSIYGFEENADFVVSQLDLRDVTAEFSEAAIRMQGQHLFLVAEGTLLTFDDSAIAKQRRHLVSMGTQLHNTTLYLTYARANDEPVDLAGAIPLIPGVTDGVQMALSGLTQSYTLESETASIGLRLDLTAGAAFKLEISENTLPHNDQSNLVRFGFHLVF